MLHADLANYIGKIDFPAMEDLGTGDSETLATPSTYGKLPLAFNCASGANDLYGILVTRDAITGEVATMDMTINLTIEQTYLGEDLTGDVKSIHFGRGKSGELGKAEVGNLSLTLNNSSGNYSPSNSAGDYYGYLKPKRVVGVRAYDDDYNYQLFYGFVEEIVPHPHLSEQDAIITAVDGIDFLARHDMATALYKDSKTGTIHDYILTDAGWLKLARLDDGQDTIPYWYGHDIKSQFAQEEIDDSEQGFSYIDGFGYFNFEDRWHRSSAEHQTSQATFNNTMSYITYSLNPKNIYNIIKVTVTPWELQANAELWRLAETSLIDVGNTLTWWGDASISGESVFVDEWTTPTPLAYSSPTGFVDPGSKWADEANTYDENMASYSSVSFPGYYLELTIASVICDRIRIYADSAITEGWRDPDVNVDVYYNSEWHNIHSGIITRLSWEEILIGSSQAVTAARIKFNSISLIAGYIYEFDFYGYDYTANSAADGSGTDMTSDISITTTKFAKTIKIEVSNNGTVPTYITLLKARGTYYNPKTAVTRKAEDSTSQNDYQKRTLEIDGKYMTNATLGQDLANYAIGKYKEPRAELGLP